MTTDITKPPLSGGKRPTTNSLLFSARTLDVQLLRLEAGLHISRFPAHQGDVTALNFEFAQCYQQAFRKQFQKTVNPDRWQNTKGLDIKLFTIGSGDEVDKAGVRKSIHYARQCADLVGLPYDRFIQFCFDFAAKRGPSKMIKQPNQLIPRVKYAAQWKSELGELVQRDRQELLTHFHPSQEKNIPSCLGILSARDETLPVCRKCPFFKGCGLVWSKVAAHIFKVEDVREPLTRTEKKRKMSANRVKKFRENLKLEKQSLNIALRSAILLGVILD